jgi:hypothetical protein
MKPGIGSIAERMIEALNCGDIKEFERLKDGSPPPKDEPRQLTSCVFHFAPERHVEPQK